MAAKRKILDVPDATSNKKSCIGDKSSSQSSKSKSSLDNWGIIESISLRNFMCHTRLTMRFSSSVNFIVGHNGSGKSAVLTAIIVGLGGKASSTNRGTSLKTLIKTGCSSAVIEITLRNNGEEPEPVKPEIYGDKIIVERRITFDGQSAYKIKSSAGKVVSTKKEDLVNILDEINLHVDNPLTCLNQEMSKNFLHSKNETDKYKFFLKSTQLEQMCRDYRFIKEQQIIIQNILAQKQKAIPDLEKVVLEKEQRFKELATLQELKNKVDTLKCELAWSQVARLEHDVKPLKRELEKENLRAPKYNAALEDCKKKEVDAQKKFDDLQKLVKQYQQDVKTLEPEKKMAKSSLDEAKSHFKTHENALNRAKRHLKETQKDRSEMEARIRELKNSAKTDVEDEKRKREEHLSSLRERLQELNAKLKTTSHQYEQFVNAVQQCETQLQSNKHDEAELIQEQKRLKQTVTNLSASKKNKLQLFGSKMPEFVRRIDEAFARNKFKHKPRGPLGNYVTLKDPNLAVPVECAIRGVIHSFIVDNHKDEKVLEGLRNSIFAAHEKSRIVIFTVKFSKNVYDVSQGRVRHPRYSSVLDLLNIEDPVVANCLIDMSHIESILVIPNTQEALETMQSGSPPHNCFRAYTKAGDEVYQDRYYSNQSDAVSKYLQADVEEEIHRNRNLLKEVEEQLRLVKQESLRISSDLKQNRHEQNRHDHMKLTIMNQRKNVNIEIRNLESVEDPQPLDVKDLEDEVLNYSQQISSIMVAIEEQTGEMQTSNQVLQDAKSKWDQIQETMKGIGESAEDLTEKINQASRNLEKAKADRVHFNEGKKKHLEAIEQLQGKSLDLKMKIEAETKKATYISKEKIVTRRTPTNIENEIKQINRRIDQEEVHRGDHETIVREYNDVREAYHVIRRRIRWSKKFNTRIASYLEQREAAFQTVRQMVSMKCTLDFNILLNQRGFKGKMKFSHNEERLSIAVQPHDNVAQSADLRVLSGGERSFSTVCFVLALWQVIQSPLRCLDEFDVFMDMANRRVAMEMIVEIALVHKYRQFIFLTPHDISALPKSPRLHVWKMADPDRSQTHLPFERVDRETD
ncbi:structural maintenance of chromosomes protein 6-like [Clavelina lepadiformis]|uniref:structural maintenance of chromosomes protein 6-like n=1 Tax=Clavelina lepadiformis TaxID=159417 RepID=UPI004042DDFF